MDRVAVFVDVQNVYYTVKQIHGCHFDYRVFWDQVTARREVVCRLRVRNRSRRSKTDSVPADPSIHRLRGEAQALHSEKRWLSEG